MLLIGVLQWLCLRSFLHADQLWIPASTIAHGDFVRLLYQSAAESSLAVLFTLAVSLFGLGWLQT